MLIYDTKNVVITSFIGIAGFVDVLFHQWLKHLVGWVKYQYCWEMVYTKNGFGRKNLKIQAWSLEFT